MLCKPDQEIGPGSFKASLDLPYQLWRLAPAASRPSFDLAELRNELRVARSKGISGRRVDLRGSVEVGGVWPPSPTPHRQAQSSTEIRRRDQAGRNEA